ncbi:MAG: VWA domain-containing protein [Prevotella sp.]|nr:VWA domain-containing protein [Prevotella sp.]
MKKSFYLFCFACAGMLFTSTALTSCSSDDDQEEVTVLVAGIPDDGDATPNPNIDNNTTNIPNIVCNTEYENGVPVIRIDMTGVQESLGNEWLRLYGTGSDKQNVWVEVDGKPKGISVRNTADDNDGNTKVMADLVFLVDNSGSMSEEADAIARDITTWSEMLSESGLDMRFGVVGYDGAITGALNITTADKLAEYLNYSYGINRTYHFGGLDAYALSTAVEPYRTGGYSSNECGTAALRFADEQFTFRNGANRIYVNFTDEPNQPAGSNGFSVEYVSTQENWNTAKGTIHTVYSDTYKDFMERPYYYEYPWRMSEYTGGTIIYCDPYFSNVTLSNLPVTGAMQNSYIIRFTNVANLMDGNTHDVKVTILTPDGKTMAEKTFSVTFAS